MSQLIFSRKEKRNSALSVRLPVSTLEKLKTIAQHSDSSQSEVIEALVNTLWKKMKLDNLKTDLKSKEKYEQ